MPKTPDITLWFLQASRAIRIAWLLEELDLPYTLISSQRAPNGLAPAEFQEKIPNPLGKSPTIKDGELVVTESGAIVEYLCETYDPTHRTLPADPARRAHAREWIAAAEGTFMLHGIAIFYARRRMPEAARPHLPAFEAGLVSNVRRDLDWLEAALRTQQAKGQRFLVGDALTAADIMMHFSVLMIMEYLIGAGAEGDGEWPEARAWLRLVEDCAAYRTAVEKTGFSMRNPAFEKVKAKA